MNTPCEFIIEDQEYERAFLAGELWEAEAVTVVGGVHALTSITTLRAAETAAREYARRYADNPFSPEAVAFLCAELAPLFRQCGYSADADSPCETITFETCLKPQVPVVTGKSGLIWCASGEAESFDFSLIEGGADDGDCALVVDGKKVLCAAGINDLRRDGYSEIYVECAANYRRRGYASACAAMLASKLIDDGQRVRYETGADNTASISLARKLGFDEIEHTASFFARGREE